MTFLPILAAIAAVHLVAVMSPGPNFLVVVQTSLQYSRRAGIAAAGGVSLGTVGWMALGFAAFGFVARNSETIFTVVRLFGAVYFAFVGVRSLVAAVRGTREPVVAADTGTPTPLQLLHAGTLRNAMRGLFTTFSNPKAALYYLVLFTTFVPPDISFEREILVATTLFLVSLAWYATVALTASIQHVRTIYGRLFRWFDGLFGGIWILLAVRLATLRR